MLAELVGASRPSVSAALKELENEGLISRRPEGGWLLHREAPAELSQSAAAASRSRPVD